MKIVHKYIYMYYIYTVKIPTLNFIKKYYTEKLTICIKIKLSDKTINFSSA